MLSASSRTFRHATGPRSPLPAIAPSPQAAADAYDRVLDEQLDLVGATLLLRRALCHYALQRWLQAAADAGRAAKLAADDSLGTRQRAEALELRGRCYIQLGDFDLAANHFRQVQNELSSCVVPVRTPSDKAKDRRRFGCCVTSV